MEELAGDASMSLEGDLQRCNFKDRIVISRDETDLLRRNTITPKLDFIVLSLIPETVDEIFNQIIKAGLDRAIVHVQIGRDGVIELAAYDNMHPECVVTGPGVDFQLLEDLRTKNVIRSFAIANYYQ
jgi:hypothetical protein